MVEITLSSRLKVEGTIILPMKEGAQLDILVGSNGTYEFAGRHL